MVRVEPHISPHAWEESVSMYLRGAEIHLEKIDLLLILQWLLIESSLSCIYEVFLSLTVDFLDEILVTCWPWRPTFSHCVSLKQHADRKHRPWQLLCLFDMFSVFDSLFHLKYKHQGIKDVYIQFEHLDPGTSPSGFGLWTCGIPVTSSMSWQNTFMTPRRSTNLWLGCWRLSI